MRDKELYSQILNIKEPWIITEVILDREKKTVIIELELTQKAIGICPRCNEPCPGYDHRVQRWRHLDTCQYQTIIEAKVLRVNCQQHGILTIKTPWAEDNSGYTALFEAIIIDWLKEASIKAIAEQFRMSWNAVDGIMQRAIERGLAKRDLKEIKNIGVDETSYQKRHEYVTVVTDRDKRKVLHIEDDHTIESLDGFFEQLTDEQKAGIESVSMDMWPAYIHSVKQHVPGAEEKIGFDKFHVAQQLGKAVDTVRKIENRKLLAQGQDSLKGTKYQWLTNPKNMLNEKWNEFSVLRKSTLKTARAWAIKEAAMGLWNYVNKAWAKKAWKAWYSWAIRSRLNSVKKVARMIDKHLWGILNAIVLGMTNAHAEGINSRIQHIKKMASGFRNRQRFKNAIYFHLGDLELYPERLCYWS